jgi:F0F1-type ATP synthase membrane subunit b/b'
MRYNFRLNTNILETNIVNLLVVIGLLVTVVAENLNETLHQRLQKVQIMFTALDEDIAQSRDKLDKAKKRLEVLIITRKISIG